MKNFIKNHKIECLFLFLMVTMFVFLVIVIPFDKAPDESARFLIADYMYKHGQFPLASEPEVRIPGWGFSYAFTPFLSYMVSAFIMKITSFFTQNRQFIIMSARLAPVLFSTISIIYIMKISKKIFTDIEQWLFIVLCSSLPMFVFVSSYVNSDALAITSSAIIIYAWIIGREDGWSKQSCITLIIGLSLCVLSYQNAYGYIALSLLLYVYETFRAWKHNCLSSMLKKGAIIAVAVIVLGGWFYIRNYMLYDGDIIGSEVNRELGELYALDHLKPSLRQTPFARGVSLTYMLIDMKWLSTSYRSFIGIFDYLSVELPRYYYTIYNGIFITGFAGLLIIVIRIKTMSKKSVLFSALLVLSIPLTIGLSMYYSYFNDFQAQGRYLLPMLIPFMLLISKGIITIANFCPSKYKKIAILGIMLLIIYLNVNMMVAVFVNHYL